MIRYDRLGYVDLNVSDVARAQAFYQDIVGLTFVEVGPRGDVRLRCSDDHHNISLRQSAEPGFRAVGLMLESDADYDALAARLAQAGLSHVVLSPEECDERRVASAWRVSQPHLQAAFEFYRPRPQDADIRFEPPLALIQRIGHVVLSTPQYEDAVRFMTDVLNFAESDSVEGMVTFFRLFPNPYHHGIGIARGPRNGLHHVNFMVSEIDDVGTAINRFRRNAVPVVFGPGRHVASTSVFLYFLEPDGMTLEYSYGMEQFPEHDAREPRALPPVPQSLDTWGGERDPRMSSAGIVQPYDVATGWAGDAG